jgi:hypothetical protein
VALKIANNNGSSACHGREVEEHISMAGPSHRGRSLIRTFLDSFEVKGPEGSYSCLVYPPMREPLSTYQRRFDDRKMPLPSLKHTFVFSSRDLIIFTKNAGQFIQVSLSSALLPLGDTEPGRLPRSKA